MFKWALGGLAALILICGLTWWSTYNGLVGKDQAVERSIADVQVDLQRQSNLLPQLAREAERAAQVETGTIIAVTQARSGIATANPRDIARDPRLQQQLFESQDGLEHALSGMRVVFERYPTLQSVGLYQTLMDETTGSQNRITRSRQKWNEATASYNQAVRSFPANLIASASGFESRDYYHATAAGQAEMPEIGLPKE